jgi:ABC-2 type transport system permease protein
MNTVSQTPIMPAGRVFRSYMIEAKYALLVSLRSPLFSIIMLALPIGLYLLIGILVVGPQLAEEPEAPAFIFSGFLVFAITGPGLFGFGIGLAMERQMGVLALKRAQPMPPGASLLAKMIMAMTTATVLIPILTTLAMLFGNVSLTPLQIACLLPVGVLGVLPFCAIGFFIGTLVSGTAAPGIVNIIYFPMLYLSGMFFPLPEILQPWALVWPTFHLNQLVWLAVGMESIIDPKICAALLIGITVLFTGLAARRLSRIG